MHVAASVDSAGGPDVQPTSDVFGRRSHVAHANQATDRQRLVAWTSTFRAHWTVVTVLAVFASTALIVPVLAPVAISDDWVYARSVEILLDEGRVEILGPTVVPLIFQLFWGALFAAVLEPTFGALRLSTFVVVLFSGAALYGVCRELGVSESRSALGTAMYLSRFRSVSPS
jgi:hypothetical protein